MNIRDVNIIIITIVISIGSYYLVCAYDKAEQSNEWKRVQTSYQQIPTQISYQQTPKNLEDQKYYCRRDDFVDSPFHECFLHESKCTTDVIQRSRACAAQTKAACVSFIREDLDSGISCWESLVYCRSFCQDRNKDYPCISGCVEITAANARTFW